VRRQQTGKSLHKVSSHSSVSKGRGLLFHLLEPVLDPPHKRCCSVIPSPGRARMKRGRFVKPEALLRCSLVYLDSGTLSLELCTRMLGDGLRVKFGSPSHNDVSECMHTVSLHFPIRDCLLFGYARFVEAITKSIKGLLVRTRLAAFIINHPHDLIIASALAHIHNGY
jgi:hypothetical protein